MRLRLGGELATDSSDDSSSLLAALSPVPSSMSAGISPSSEGSELSGEDSSDKELMFAVVVVGRLFVQFVGDRR